MESAQPQQVFIRNQKGLVWGPLSPETVELMIDNGILEGPVQVSWDGLNFAFPGRFPELREFFPRELWGDGTAASTPAAPRTERAAAPVEVSPLAPAPVRAAGIPMAGPGARAASDPSIHTARPVGAAPRAPPAVAPPARAPAPAPVLAPAAVPMATAPAPGAPAQVPAAPTPKVTAPEAAPAGPGPSLPPPPASGDLTKLAPVHLYYLVASGDHTGLLAFRLPDRRIEVHFRKGNPEHVASDHAEDALAGFLLKQGLVGADQIAQAEAQKDRFGGELVGALFGLGVLNPGTAFAQLTQRAQALLLKALLAEAGTFTYEAKDLPPQKAMPMGNRWAVLTETVRRIPASEIQRRLHAALDLPVMKSGGRISASDLRFTPREARALSFIDGVRSLNQLCADMPAEQENLLHVAFLLQHLEAVSFAAVPVRAEPPKPAAAPVPKPAAPSPAPAPAANPQPAPPKAVPQTPKVPAPARPATPAVAAAPASPVAPANPEAELPSLRALAKKIATQNYFEMLGVTDKADAGAIKVAYFKLAKQYHPDTVPPGVPAEYAKLKADIFGAVGEANRRLSDDASRAEYIEELKTGGGQSVDVAQIFAAEEMFAKAQILVKARKFPEAVAMLEDAIKANPEEGEFYAWRGYAKFFLGKDRASGLVTAVKDIQLALKKNERCAQAHYFHGSMAKLAGDTVTAQKEFKLTLALQPDHIDAQREVRMLAGKK